MPENSDLHQKRFEESLEGLNDPGGLFRTALLISALHYPTLADGWWKEWHDRIDVLVDEIRQRLEQIQADSEEERFIRFADYFSDTLGFTGNADDYHSPENSCLNRVLETRLGLPITLSVVMITLGEQLGFEIFGVGAPGHFLTGVRVNNRLFYLNPFSGPDLLDEKTAAATVGKMIGLEPEQIAPFMTASEPRDIISRMLNNLKVSYMNAEEITKLLKTLDWALILDPDNIVELRNRGLLLLREGEHQRGAADLLKYIQSNPDDDDLPLIHAEALRAKKRRDRGE